MGESLRCKIGQFLWSPKMGYSNIMIMKILFVLKAVPLNIYVIEYYIEVLL